MTALPRSMTDIAAELRRQLDESEGGRVIERKHREMADERNALLARQVDEVNRQVEDLRAVLLGTARDLEIDGRQLERGADFWYTAWSREKQRNAEIGIKLAKQARWLLDCGQEATRLQAELEVQRGERNTLSSQLDATQARCDELERELDRLRQRLSEGASSTEVD